MRRHRAFVAAVAASLLAIAALPAGDARAQQARKPASSAPKPRALVIYRCTAADGAVTVQNGIACPKGTRQEKRSLAATPASPAPVPSSPAPAPVAPGIGLTPPPQIPDAVFGYPAKPAPEAPAATSVVDAGLPPLFACKRIDETAYYSENRDPPPQCARLATTGINGGNALAAGEACEMVRDTCTQVPEAEQCAAWKAYARDAQTRWKRGAGDDPLRDEAEALRITGRLALSGCR